MTQLIRGINTAELVKVIKVAPTADAVGFVDVQPLVQQRTTAGIVLDTAPMFRLPYMRAQGGTAAVIIDPVVGDIGLAVFAQRDITAAVAVRGEAAAATNRAYDAGDGLYLGGFLNQDPVQWLKFFEGAGAQIKTPLLTVDAELRVSGNVRMGTGYSGSFKDGDGNTITVANGQIVNKF